jgi:hypothetical protein
MQNVDIKTIYLTYNAKYNFPLFIYVDDNSKLTYSNEEYFNENIPDFVYKKIINWKKFNRSLKLKSIK